MFCNHVFSKKTIVLLCSIISSPVWAVDPLCNGEEIEVTGEVHTYNTGATTQYGVINLATKDANGAIIPGTETNGTISGQISSKKGVRTILNHEIIFSSTDSLRTTNDVALTRMPALEVDANNVGCKFKVYEAITTVNGTYDGREVLSGSLFAEGSINFCPSAFMDQEFDNNFVINGSVCVAP